LFVYVGCSPLVDFVQEKLKVPQAVSVALTMLLILVFFGLCFFFVAISIEEFVRGAEVYRDRVLRIVDSSASFLESQGFDLRVESLKNDLSELPVFSVVKQLTGGAISVVSNLFLILIFVIFMLVGGTIRHSKSQLVKELTHKISSYIVVKLLVSLATGFLVGGLLLVMKVELAFMFALLTVLLNFIPSVGSILATAVLMPILILQYGFGWQFFLVLSGAGAIQVIIGNVIEPKLMGDSMDLHPVAIIISLLFWGLVWGVPGMFMAVPITAVVKIVLARIPPTRGLAELLAGRLPGEQSV
ncbi:MAG: AI-2E family transporter, partial [Pseudomonadota bacterium]